MPMRRRTYRRRRPVARKRVYKRRYATRRRIPRPIGPPTHMYQKVKYFSLRQVSLAASTLEQRQWSLNSLFDPDVSGVGGQPYYHDQFSTMFQRYRVYGCKVTVKYNYGLNSSSGYSPTIAIVPWTGATPSWSTIDTALNVKGAVWGMMNLYQKPQTFKKYYNIAHLFGVPKKEVADDDAYQALVTASPSKQAYLYVMINNNDGTNALVVSIAIQLTYYCKYYQNVEPSAS